MVRKRYVLRLIAKKMKKLEYQPLFLLAAGATCEKLSL